MEEFDEGNPPPGRGQAGRNLRDVSRSGDGRIRGVRPSDEGHLDISELNDVIGFDVEILYSAILTGYSGNIRRRSD